MSAGSKNSEMTVYRYVPSPVYPRALYCLHIVHSSVFSSDTLCIVYGLVFTATMESLPVWQFAMKHWLSHWGWSQHLSQWQRRKFEQTVYVADVFDTVTTVTVTGIAIVSKVSISNKQADAYEQR